MNVWIASDLHGSALYCRKLLDLMEKRGADRLVLLGDLLYHGPRNDLPAGYDPKAVFAMLNGVKDKILCVHGNCDAEVDQMVLDFPVMAEYCILYEQQHMIFATHGHIYNNANLPKLKQDDILLHGHTHVPVVEEYDTHIYMNPGSVSIPKEGSCHSYMVLENGTFMWKDLEGKEYQRYALKR